MRESLRRQLRITWHLPAVLLVLFAIAAGAASFNWLTSPRPRVVRLTGTHYEIGLQHGRLLRAEIRALWNGYVVHGLAEKEHHSVADLVAAARHYDHLIPQPLREEMRGIADGAEVPYDEIVVINTFADAMLGGQRFCSALAVNGNDGLLIGRNLDWTDHDVAHRSGVVFILEPKGERRVMSVGWPGMVGVVTGMNDRGLTVTMNIAFASDVETEAMPSLIRIRDALDHETTVDGAVARATSTPRTMAMNWMVADSRRAVVVEMSGHRAATRPMEGVCEVTTNYYESLPIAGGSGGDRSATLRRAFASGTATVGQIERALLRVAFFGGAHGINTIQSVVFDPKQLAAHVAIGKLPAPSGRFYRVAM